MFVRQLLKSLNARERKCFPADSTQHGPLARFEKPTFSQVVEKFPAFYGTIRLSSLFTTVPGPYLLRDEFKKLCQNLFIKRNFNTDILSIPCVLWFLRFTFLRHKICETFSSPLCVAFY